MTKTSLRKQVADLEAEIDELQETVDIQAKEIKKLRADLKAAGNEEE